MARPARPGVVPSTGVAEVTVVVCSRDGARGIVGCLDALAAQDHPSYDVVVVDDGSTDATAALAVAHPLRPRVVRHELNRGLGRARGTGIGTTTSPLVAFTDDDCLPGPHWLAGLVAALDAAPAAVAVGGSVRAAAADTPARRYAAATVPLSPVEEGTAAAGALGRLAGYLAANRGARTGTGRDREVASLVGASMLVRRSALAGIGGFDPAIRFGGDEEDLCRRLRAEYGAAAVRFCPGVVLDHDFDPGLADVLRRARAYGRGNARTWSRAAARGGSAVPPLRPFPLLLGLGALAGLRWRGAAVATALAPVLLYPPARFAGARHPGAAGRAETVAFSYLAAAEDTATLVGFLAAWRTARREARTR